MALTTDSLNAMTRRTCRMVLSVGVMLSGSGASAQPACSNEPLAVQVLGSGGPHAGGTRASAGYLVWRSGRPIVMVDAGGGTFLRFGEAGARLQDLSLLAISHLHPDHVADLTALLWLSEQSRKELLKIAGPSGGGGFPAFDVFLRRLFDSTGAFPILGGTLGREGRGTRLDVVTVDATIGATSAIWPNNDVEVTAMGVPHGTVPSVAYRIRVGERSIVFGSDQNGSESRFANFAAGADLLVMHFSLSERAPDATARLHARPSVIGQVAQAAKPKRLVLSHFIKPPAFEASPESFSLFDLDGAVAEVRKRFSGLIETAADLQCIPIR